MILLVVVLLFSCSYEPKGEEAIEAANFYLSKNKCESALDVLNRNPASSVYYFQIKASAIACTAGYSEIDILEYDIPKIDESGDFSDITKITGALESNGITDFKYQKLKEAFDTLTYMGADPRYVDPSTIDATSMSILESLYFNPNRISINTIRNFGLHPGATGLNLDSMKFPSPSTSYRLTRMDPEDSDDTNLQALGMLIVNFSKFLAYYGNVERGPGGRMGKGLKDPGANQCFASYSNYTFSIMELLALNYGPCNRGETGHVDIGPVNDLDSARILCN